MNILYADAITEDPSNIIYVPYLTPLPIKLICNVTGTSQPIRNSEGKQMLACICHGSVAVHSLSIHKLLNE